MSISRRTLLARTGQVGILLSTGCVGSDGTDDLRWIDDIFGVVIDEPLSGLPITPASEIPLEDYPILEALLEACLAADQDDKTHGIVRGDCNEKYHSAVTNEGTGDERREIAEVLDTLPSFDGEIDGTETCLPDGYLIGYESTIIAIRYIELHT